MRHRRRSGSKACRNWRWQQFQSQQERSSARLKRCKPVECPIADSLYYQILKHLRRIVNGCQKRDEIPARVGTWLRKQNTSDYLISEMQKNWYYLHRAACEVI